MKPYTDYVVTLGELKKAIEKNPYDPKQDIEGYMRYLKYNTKEEKRKWISCSERLPEEKQDVLMQFPSSMSVGFWEMVFDEITWYVNTGDGYFTGMDGIGDCEPLAWMPLPEPYEGEIK